MYKTIDNAKRQADDISTVNDSGVCFYDAAPGPTCIKRRAGDGRVVIEVDSVESFEVGDDKVQTNMSLCAPDGSAVAPAYSFTSETGTGAYLDAPGRIGIASAGTEVVTISGSTLSSDILISAPDGTESSLSVRGNTDFDSGIFFTGKKTGVAIDGSEVFGIDTTDVTSTVPIHAPDGTALAPAFAFANATDTGLFYETGVGDELKLSVGGNTVATFCQGSSNNIDIDNQNGERILMNDAGTSIQFFTAGDEDFRVDNTTITAFKPVRTLDGSVSAPALSFTSNSDTGMFLDGSVLKTSIDGVSKIEVDATDTLFTNNVCVSTGVGALELLGDIPDYPTVFNTSTADTLQLASNGNIYLSFDANNNTTAATFRIFANGQNGSGDQVFIINELGVAEFVNQVRFSDGTLAIPALSFFSDRDTGISRLAPDTMTFSCGAAKAFDVNTSRVDSDIPIHAPDGSQAAPTYSFTSETGTGVYLDAPGRIGVASAGTEVVTISGSTLSSDILISAPDGTESSLSVRGNTDFDSGIFFTGKKTGVAIDASEVFGIDTTDVTSTLPIHAPDGTALAPAFAFANATDTGVFYETGVGDELKLTVGGNTVAAFCQGSTNNIDINNQNGERIFINDGGTAIQFFTGGDEDFRVDNTKVTAFKPVRASDGSQTAPTYSFTSDTNLGIYRIGADNIGLSAGGVNQLDIDVDRTKLGGYLELKALASEPLAAPKASVAWDNVNNIPVYADGTVWKKFSDDTTHTW